MIIPEPVNQASEITMISASIGPLTTKPTRVSEITDQPTEVQVALRQGGGATKDGRHHFLRGGHFLNGRFLKHRNWTTIVSGFVSETYIIIYYILNYLEY